MSQGLVILITGTSRGLGLCLAEHFLSKGDTVIGCARSAGAIEHIRYHHFIVDLFDFRKIEEFFFQVRKITDRMDALINSAGVARMNAFALTPVKSLERTMRINFNATFQCSQRAISLLRKSSAPRIINMSTVAVPLSLEGEAVYAASKSAVETLTRIMAKELGGFGITCNAVGPSPIRTDLIRGVGEAKIKELVSKQAIKQMAVPEDVINVVNFFLLPESKMITGQIIYLGGIS